MEPNVLLIRHAQAVGNLSGKIGYSGGDDVLTEEGISQARGLGPTIREIIGSRVHQIYLSCAHRTLQTARYSGIIDHQTEFIITSHLNEIHMGALLGRSPRDEDETGTPYVRTIVNVLRGNGTFPGGESLQDVRERMGSFLFSLNPAILHVCFTHGGAITAILGDRPKNASITQLYISNNTITPL